MAKMDGFVCCSNSQHNAGSPHKVFFFTSCKWTRLNLILHDFSCIQKTKTKHVTCDNVEELARSDAPTDNVLLNLKLPSALRCFIVRVGVVEVRSSKALHTTCSAPKSRHTHLPTC